MDFLEKNVGQWTCENVLNHYKENDSQLTLKQALDSINKDLKRIAKHGSDAKCREKAESIIVNWKKLNNSWLFGYELLVPAKPFHSWSIGDELLEWTKDAKKNSRMQELNFERDILMAEQHNEVIRTAVVRDQAVRTTLTRQLKTFENEPHVQTSTRKRRNLNDEFTQNENDHEEVPQEERDELDNQRKGDEKNKTSNKRKDCEEEEECSSILFDEKNEDSLIESIDESRLISETRLPISKTSDNISEYKLSNGSDLLTMFKKYQKSIPKCRRVTTPAYWGILDLTRESLNGCKEFSEKDIQDLSQDFSNTISWDPKSAPNYLQEYFNKNCEEIHQIKDIKKLHTNIQFIKENMDPFNDSMTEEELKMISAFPLFRSILQRNVVKDAWGEIQVYSTKDARNENSSPFLRTRLGRKVDMKGTLKNTPNKFEALFGEVSGGMTSLGISSSPRKKRYLDKVKLSIMMRDSLNYALKGCRHVDDNQRKSLVVYGWLQVGFELNFYAMNWFGGLYRFGLLDHCILPSQEDDCGLFEDIYCILKELNVKLLQTEKSVKELYRSNMLGKRRRITMENSPVLNMNRTPN
ncbi:2536_t:CDS:10 [Paraglomus brasilianum]|uniref:2536_t:CDS:1 n=1 Tax=Paraglomus brasilianum TaxID=144538 RepID=A0A9N9DKI1_9GLOM|nr:2536_t:CDS:10 [Paraglomus brasilianum]